MKKQKTNTVRISGANKNMYLLKSALALGIAFSLCIAFAQQTDNRSNSNSKESLLDQYVSSKGTGIISFDAKNIKQFWIDKTVLSKNDSIFISLSDYESIPLKLQLINVNETMDCSVEVITKDSDVSFSVLDSAQKKISTSNKQDVFIEYHILSLSFHLEKTINNTFFLKFSSESNQTIEIKKIILSFSRNTNPSFLSTPGTLILSKEKIDLNNATWEKDNNLTVTGKKSTLLSKKNILVSDNDISTSVKVKNSGSEPVQIYVGYGLYTKDGQKINNRNVPYNNINKILKVVSSEANSNKIIVDSYSEWKKGCFLVLNAKEDLSDFPNFSIVENIIVDVKKIDDNHTEITFQKPLKEAIEKDTPVRIHSPHGGTYLYTNSRVLQPGEESLFKSTIKKDDSFFQYSPKALCKGVYYIVPVILSYSKNQDMENTVTISEYTISY